MRHTRAIGWPKLDCGGSQPVPQTRNDEIDEAAQLERQAALLGVDQVHRTGHGLVGFEQQPQQNFLAPPLGAPA